MPRYYDIHTHNPRPEVCSPEAVGIHPWDAAEDMPLPDFTTADIVGETGIDTLCGVPLDTQERLFRRHLAEAERLSKPVVLHVVRSFERVMSILDNYKVRGVVFHSFVGSMQQAARCAERSYHLSFGVRSLGSSRTREVIARYPAELLFAETDDRTLPSIESIYDEVAQLRGCSIESLARDIEYNYNKLIYSK